VWHDKDSSLLKGPEQPSRALNFAAFTDNSDVSLSEKNLERDLQQKIVIPSSCMLMGHRPIFLYGAVRYSTPNRTCTSLSVKINYLQFYEFFTYIRHNCRREGLQNLILTRLQNLILWSALGAFEQGGIFIVPHLL
jgi:hypothetical protein